MFAFKGVFGTKLAPELLFWAVTYHGEKRSTRLSLRLMGERRGYANVGLSAAPRP